MSTQTENKNGQGKVQEWAYHPYSFGCKSRLVHPLGQSAKLVHHIHNGIQNK